MLQLEQQLTEVLAPQDIAELTERAGQIAVGYIPESIEETTLRPFNDGGYEGNVDEDEMDQKSGQKPKSGFLNEPHNGGEEDLGDDGYNPDEDNLRKKNK